MIAAGARQQQPETDDAKRVMSQLVAGKDLLTGLDLLLQLGVVRFDRGQVGQGIVDVARGKQHARHDKLLDGVGVGAGRIEHRYASLRHRRNWNVVGS